MDISVLLLAIFWALVSYLIYEFRWNIKYLWSLRSIPSPPAPPILGHMAYARTDSHVYLFNLLRKYAKTGPIYKLYAFVWAAVHIRCPKDIEIILSSTKHIEKSRDYKCLHAWLGTGLLTSNGQKWHSRRKILTPAFHFNILLQFVNTFVEQSQKCTEGLKEQCHLPKIDVTSCMSDYTLKSICETAMGTSMTDDDEQKKYRNLIYRIGKITVKKIFKPYIYETFLRWFYKIHYEYTAIADTLHDFTKKVIEARKATFDPANVPRDDEEYSSRRYKNLAMLDLLLLAKHQGKNIDDEGILEEVDTFTFEGHDTTATSLAFTLMLLANNKDAQDKIVEEINEVLPSFGPKNISTPTYNDLQNLNYMENCIKESLRLYPSVPLISRVTGEDAVLSGYKLCKGTWLYVHIYDLHHDENVWPDPEKFDPDRFLPENVQGRHPYAYLPFSAGPRNCIGQKFAMLEMKTILLFILREFELLPVDTPESISLISDIVLRTEHRIRVKIVVRQK